MAIEYIKEKSDGSFAGGPFADGEFYLNFSRESPLWQEVEAWIEAGNTPEVYVEAPRPAPPITRRQLRLTLVRNGISLSTVEATIEAMPEGLEKAEAQIEWADASTFERSHPTLLLIASALGLTEAQIDAMWLEAASA